MHLINWTWATLSTYNRNSKQLWCTHIFHTLHLDLAIVLLNICMVCMHYLAIIILFTTASILMLIFHLIYVSLQRERFLRHSDTGPGPSCDWPSADLNTSPTGASSLKESSSAGSRPRAWSVRTFQDFLPPLPQLHKKWCSWNSTSPFTKLVDSVSTWAFAVFYSHGHLQYVERCMKWWLLVTKARLVWKFWLSWISILAWDG